MFRFSQRNGALLAIEILLGEKVDLVEAITGAKCHATDDRCIGCCSLADRILVMAGEGSDFSAVLVGIDDGKLTDKSIHTLTLTVIGDTEWLGTPFLTQISENRVFLYFHSQCGVWTCKIAGNIISMTKHDTLPDARFSTLPVRLSDERLVMAGDLWLTDITVISTDGEPRLETIGAFPGEARNGSSVTFLRNRFLVGFGGYGLGDLWIFDLEARKGSEVREEGEWHPDDGLVPIVARDDTLYLIGGPIGRAVSAIDFDSLARLAEDSEVGKAFSDLLREGKS